MSISSASAKELAMMGANIIISAESSCSSASVKQIIGIVVGKGKHITVHADRYSSASLKEMTMMGGDNITIKI